MKFVRIFFWLLCAVCFFTNFYVWGGIKDTPHVGTELMKSARTISGNVSFWFSISPPYHTR